MNWEELIAAFGEKLAEGHHVLTVPVQSSAISQLEYDESNGDMTITFTDGTVTTPPYPNITQDQFASFVNAKPSIGGFYNAVVRGRW